MSCARGVILECTTSTLLVYTAVRTHISVDKSVDNSYVAAVQLLFEGGFDVCRMILLRHVESDTCPYIFEGGFHAVPVYRYNKKQVKNSTNTFGEA